jgi:hypothetical protein
MSEPIKDNRLHYLIRFMVIDSIKDPQKGIEKYDWAPDELIPAIRKYRSAIVNFFYWYWHLGLSVKEEPVTICAKYWRRMA